MTKTTLPLLSLLAAFAVQACAAPTTDDVSSDGVTPKQADEGTVEQSAKASPAAALAGSFGDRPATMNAGIEGAGGGEMLAGEHVYGQLYIASRKQTYDVLAYSFGVASDVSTEGGSSAKLVARPNFSDLSLVIAKKDGLPSFTKDLFGGKPLGEIVLRQRDALGKYVDVATFDGAIVTNVSTNASGDIPSESVAINMHAMKLHQGSSWVSVDLVKNETKCSEPCPCNGVAGQIGPYVYTASSTTPIEKGAKRVETLAVSVSNAASMAGAAGTADTTNAPQLDGIAVTSKYDTSGMCAVYQAAGQTQTIPSVRLGVGVYSAKEPRESTTWEACHAHVESVSFSSRFDTMGQAITLDAAGLMRTDREWSSMNVLSSSSVGWSFAKDSAIVSCSETLAN